MSERPGARGPTTPAGLPLRPGDGVEIRRRIAILPETPGLYLRLSVCENLECFADLYEVGRPAPGPPGDAHAAPPLTSAAATAAGP